MYISLVNCPEQKNYKQLICNANFAQEQAWIQWVVDLETQIKELESHHKVVDQQVGILSATIHELKLKDI